MSDSLLRPMLESDLGSVLSWRNDQSIRSYMFSQNIISFHEHKQWFDACKENPHKHCLIFSSNNIDSGFVSFDISDNIGFWGFYLAPDAAKGLAKLLGQVAIKYGFKELQLKKITGKVISYNEKSIRFHENMGFIKSKNNSDSCFIGGKEYSVFSYSMENKVNENINEKL